MTCVENKARQKEGMPLKRHAMKKVRLKKVRQNKAHRHAGKQGTQYLYHG